MLSSYSDLEGEVLELIQEEIRGVLAAKIESLVTALFENDIEQWLKLLLIDRPTEEQLLYVDKIDGLIRHGVDKDEINIDDVDEIAKTILQVRPRTE